MAFVAGAQSYPALRLSENEGRSITKEALIKDIDEYGSFIAKNHINPFTLIKKKTFFGHLENVKLNAPNYDVDQLLVELLKVNAEIGDEHTNILYVSRDIFPFRCYWFDEGICITRADNEDTNYLFSRIIAVNDIPVDDVVIRISSLIPDRNPANIKNRVPEFLFDPFVLHGLRISSARGKVKYTLVNRKNDTISIDPIAVNRKNVQLKSRLKDYYAHPKERVNNWFTYTDSNKLIYFSYSSCYDDSTKAVKQLISELSTCIEQKKPQKLVIDLRYNRGGYPGLLWPFIEYLKTSPLNKNGRLYVLVGRSTYSAAVINASEIRLALYSKILGEETAGVVAFYGAVRYGKMSNTGLRFSYSTDYVQLDEKYKGSLRPDVVISESVADFIAGKDPVLGYVLTH